MDTEQDLRRELGAVADRLPQPHVELAGIVRLGERERGRRRALATAAVAAAAAVVIVLVPTLVGTWAGRDRRAAQPVGPAPGQTHAAPTLRADLDGDGRPDDVAVDEPAGTVTVTPSSGGDTLRWALPHHSAVDLLGAADLGHGRQGVVLEGWTDDGGSTGAVVLIVRDGRLQRARPSTVIDRDRTQTMWVEHGVFRHALCLCTRGWQQVSVYRVELRADGRTLRSVEEAGRCWNPASHRPPQLPGYPAC